MTVDVGLRDREIASDLAPDRRTRFHQIDEGEQGGLFRVRLSAQDLEPRDVELVVGEILPYAAPGYRYTLVIEPCSDVDPSLCPRVEEDDDSDDDDFDDDDGW